MNDTQTFLDRSRWASGPWDDEPDREQWTDEASGLDCLIRRGPSGALCGYVAVGPDHPWFRIGYSACTQECDHIYCDHIYCDHSPHDLTDAHGGLTYASECDGDTEQGICHRTEGDDRAWWFGFDCAHAGDIMPRTVPNLSRDISDAFDGYHFGETYKDWRYVRSEVEALAAQLAEVQA